MPALKRKRRRKKINKPVVVVNALVILLLLLPAAGSWSWYDIPSPNGFGTIHEGVGLDTYTTYEWYANADDGTSTTQSDYWSFTPAAILQSPSNLQSTTGNFWVNYTWKETLVESPKNSTSNITVDNITVKNGSWCRGGI